MAEIFLKPAINKLSIKFSAVILWILSIAGITFILFMVVYFPNYARLKRLKEANSRMDSDIKKLEMEIEDLQKRIRLTRGNTEVFEKFARDELGMAKEGEIVIDIEE